MLVDCRAVALTLATANQNVAYALGPIAAQGGNRSVPSYSQLDTAKLRSQSGQCSSRALHHNNNNNYYSSKIEIKINCVSTS